MSFLDKLMEKQKEHNEKYAEKIKNRVDKIEEIRAKGNSKLNNIQEKKDKKICEYYSNNKKEEKEVLKNKEKEDKKKEFERIMASNPELSDETKRNIEKAKLVPKEPSKRQKEKQYQKDRLKQLKRDHVPYCPKCKSTSLTYTNKKLSVGRAVTGKLLFGSDGAILGGLTSKKGYVKCLNCGHQWKL